MGITVAGDRIYRVSSETSDRVYVVDMNVCSCTCPDWAIKRNRLVGKAQEAGQPTDHIRYECKHIREVHDQTGLPAFTTAPVTAAAQQKARSEETKRKVDAIVNKFTAPGIKKKAIETLRDAAAMKKKE